jgi:hypothetical protein
LPVQAAPTDQDIASSELWLYRSTVDMTGDANAGLLGPLIVTRASAALPDGQPSDVAQSFVLVFQVPGAHLTASHCGAPACQPPSDLKSRYFLSSKLSE